MLLIGLVALLVFGPERLPRVAREAALWIRKARDMASSVKAEVDRELQLQDLRDGMAKQKREMERLLTEERKPEPVARTESDEEGRHE